MSFINTAILHRVFPFRLLRRQVQTEPQVQVDLSFLRERVPDTFDVAAVCTCASHTSRDFYDVFATARGGCAFVLGNASGRGTPATALMGIIHPLIRATGWTESAAQHEGASSRMNRLLCARAQRAQEAAMFWAYFDARNQLLRYVNAGHPPPLLFKGNRRNILLRLRTGGPALGILPHLAFQQGAVRLDPGDVLILYSNGVLKATDPHGEVFGEERLRSVVANHLEKGAEEIRARILASVEAFTRQAAAEDDRTLLVVRYAGIASRSDQTESSTADTHRIGAAA